MKRRVFPSGASWSCLVALAVVAALSASWAVGAEAGAAPAAEKSEAKKARKTTARLPMYYAQIGLSAEQRAKILKTLDDYAPKLADLRAQLEAMTKERDDAVQGELTDEQRQKLDDLKAAAKTKRQSGKEANKEEAAQETPPVKEPASPKRGKKSSG